jgi:hypothetical protein
MVNVPRNDVPSPNTSQAMVGAADTLKHTINRFGRVDLHDTADAADVNPKFQT